MLLQYPVSLLPKLYFAVYVTSGAASSFSSPIVSVSLDAVSQPQMSVSLLSYF